MQEETIPWEHRAHADHSLAALLAEMDARLPALLPECQQCIDCWEEISSGEGVMVGDPEMWRAPRCAVCDESYVRALSRQEDRLQRIITSFADRIGAQSDLLSGRAER